jgi:hypothetical protein
MAYKELTKYLQSWELKSIGIFLCMFFINGINFADSWKAGTNATAVTGAIVPSSANTKFGVGLITAPVKWRTEIKGYATIGTADSAWKVFRLTSGLTSGTSNITLSASPTAGNYFVLNAAVGNGIIFSTGTEVASTGIGATEQMRILSTGYVGIGTTNPSAKLEVAGQVKITGGTPGLNKVLTSDANGLASWQTPVVANYLNGPNGHLNSQYYKQ